MTSFRVELSIIGPKWVGTGHHGSHRSRNREFRMKTDICSSPCLGQLVASRSRQRIYTENTATQHFFVTASRSLRPTETRIPGQPFWANFENKYGPLDHFTWPRSDFGDQNPFLRVNWAKKEDSFNLGREKRRQQGRWELHGKIQFFGFHH